MANLAGCQIKNNNVQFNKYNERGGMGDAGRPILIGTPPAVQVLQSNTILGRRFPEKCYLLI